jgi:hypothetical protein
MQSQDDFFEKGLAEILSSSSTTEPITEQIENQAKIPQIQTPKKNHYPFSDIIVRLLAAFVAISLLFGFSAKIYLR